MCGSEKLCKLVFFKCLSFVVITYYSPVFKSLCTIFLWFVFIIIFIIIIAISTSKDLTQKKKKKNKTTIILVHMLKRQKRKSNSVSKRPREDALDLKRASLRDEHKAVKNEQKKKEACSDVELLPTAERLLKELIPSDVSSTFSGTVECPRKCSSMFETVLVKRGHHLKKEKSSYHLDTKGGRVFSSLGALLPELEKDYHSQSIKKRDNQKKKVERSVSSHSVCDALKEKKSVSSKKGEKNSEACSSLKKDHHAPKENFNSKVEPTLCRSASDKKKSLKALKDVSAEKQQKEGRYEDENEKDNEEDQKAAEEVLRRASLFIHKLSPKEQQAFWSLREVAKGNKKKTAEGGYEKGGGCSKLRNVEKNENRGKRLRRDPTDLSSGYEPALQMKKKEPRNLRSKDDMESTCDIESCSENTSSEPSWISESEEEEEIEESSNSNNKQKTLPKASGKEGGGGRLFCTNEGWSDEDDGFE